MPSPFYFKGEGGVTVFCSRSKYLLFSLLSNSS
jgi:hypothetical protein